MDPVLTRGKACLRSRGPCPGAEVVIAGLMLSLLFLPNLCHTASVVRPSICKPCLAWGANSVQNVTVDGLARYGAAELINVSVTFFALPQSTIVLDGWSMRGGGWVAIQGPPEAPWSIRDVTVIVTNSVIEAVDGPAVSVVLGSGFDNTNFSAARDVVLRNVSLYCNGSRLWSSSSSSGGAPRSSTAAAAVLSVVFATALTSSASAAPMNVTIDGFTAVAIDSDLRSTAVATANSTAAVLSIAAAQYGGASSLTPAWIEVTGSTLYAMRCNATAVASGGDSGAASTEAAAAVSAVAGMGFGRLSSRALVVRGTTTAVLNSSVVARSNINNSQSAFAASTVAGIAVGYASAASPITASDGTMFYIGWSNVVSVTLCASSIGNGFSASSVGGAAVGIADSHSPVTIADNAAFSTLWSNATSAATITSNSTLRNAYAASTVAGVAAGVANNYSPIGIVKSTFFVGWSAVRCGSVVSGDKALTYVGSSVAGVATSQASASSPITVTNSSNFTVVWSNTASTTTSTRSYALSASTLAGIAVGHAYTLSSITVADSTTFYLGWCNAISASKSISSEYSRFGAACVAGVAATIVDDHSAITVADRTTLFVGWSAVTTITGSSNESSAYTGASVAGVAVSQASNYSPITVTNSTNFTVVWSNATTISVSTSSSAVAASTISGIAVGFAYILSSITVADRTTFYAGWCNASSTIESTTSANNAYVASTVAGVAVACAASLSPMVISNRATFAVAESNASATCVSTSKTGNLHTGSTVAGVALGLAFNGSFITIANATTFYIGRCHAVSTSGSVSQNGNTYAGSSVGGVAVAQPVTNSAVTISDGVTIYAEWCNISTSTNTSTTGYALAASSATGVAAGCTSSPTAIVNRVAFSVVRCSVSCVSSGVTAGVYSPFSGSSVAGVTVGFADAACPITVTNVTFYVGWSTATSQSIGTGSASDTYSASTVAGVVAGYAGVSSPVTLNDNTTLYVEWSTAVSSTNATSSVSNVPYGASSVAGVAAGSSSTAPLNAALSVASASDIAACVASRSQAVFFSASCLRTPATLSVASSNGALLCCRLVTPVNTSFPPPIVLPPLQEPWMGLPNAVPPTPLPGVSLPAIALPPSLVAVTRTLTGTDTPSLNRTDSASLSTSASRSATRSGTPTFISSMSLSASATRSRTRSLRTRTLTVSSTLSAPSLSGTPSRRRRNSLTASASPSGHRTPTESVTPSLHARVGPPSPAVVTVLHTTTVSVAVVATVVSIGNPTSGANAGRINVLLRMASCEEGSDADEHQDALPWSSHPLEFAVSSAGPAVQYDAGAVIGNTAISVGVVALHFAILCIRAWARHRGSEAQRAVQLVRAAAWVRFPGLSSTVHLYLMPLVAQSAVSCIAQGTSVGVVTGAWAMLVLACVVTCLTYHTVRTLAERLECNPVSADAVASTALCGGWLVPSSENERSPTVAAMTPEQLCACFGAYFEDYHYASRWWLTVELTVALVSGMIGGLMDTSVGCAVVQALGVVPNVLYLVLLLWRLPHQRRLDFAMCVVVGTLLLTSAVALCAGSTDAASWLALAASLVSIAPALCTPYKLAQQLAAWRRRKLQRQEEKRRHLQSHSHVAVLDPTDDSELSAVQPMLEFAALAPSKASACETSSSSVDGGDAAVALNSDGIGRLLDDLLRLRDERPRDTVVAASAIWDLDALLSTSTAGSATIHQ